jgi:hypothetical protein
MQSYHPWCRTRRRPAIVEEIAHQHVRCIAVRCLRLCSELASATPNAHTAYDYEEYEWEGQEGDKLVVNTRNVRAMHLTVATLDAPPEFAPRKAPARTQQPRRASLSCRNRAMVPARRADRRGSSS